MALPFPLNLSAALSGDGPVSQRIDAKKGDRNFVFQVGSGLSADTGGNSGAGSSGSSLPVAVGNVGPWVLAAAVVLAVVLFLLPSRKS